MYKLELLLRYVAYYFEKSYVYFLITGTLLQKKNRDPHTLLWNSFPVVIDKSFPWVWKDVSATLWSSRYIFSYPRGRSILKTGFMCFTLAQWLQTLLLHSIVQSHLTAATTLPWYQVHHRSLEVPAHPSHRFHPANKTELSIQPLWYYDRIA